MESKMTNETNYTSLELSKKLKEAGCMLESRSMWIKRFHQENYILCTCPFDVIFHTVGNGVEEGDEVKAYDILNDICVKYATEFFGEEEVCIACGNKEPAYEYHSKQILELLQQGRKSDAELYIWEFSGKLKKACQSGRT